MSHIFRSSVAGEQQQKCWIGSWQLEGRSRTHAERPYYGRLPPAEATDLRRTRSRQPPTGRARQQICQVPAALAVAEREVLRTFASGSHLLAEFLEYGVCRLGCSHPDFKYGAQEKHKLTLWQPCSWTLGCNQCSLHRSFLGCKPLEDNYLFCREQYFTEVSLRGELAAEARLVAEALEERTFALDPATVPTLQSPLPWQDDEGFPAEQHLAPASEDCFDLQFRAKHLSAAQQRSSKPLAKRRKGTGKVARSSEPSGVKSSPEARRKARRAKWQQYAVTGALAGVRASRTTTLSSFAKAFQSCLYFPSWTSILVQTCCLLSKNGLHTPHGPAGRGWSYRACSKAPSTGSPPLCDSQPDRSVAQGQIAVIAATEGYS